ncbi:MAG: hypothetical protein A2268_13785 [Candidatus Raymondbacteria bacterium RifOxyA12_full_50_37]|uniref:Uncharacterized protein n=1 Tax=Candidatus Raymondbacteria bacterium RIFOXYD12_FULL_49_13 TaxID=1817890 RepID=A0A1F7FM68_UNCRA|nr:MAG: hypothetical protein A2248_08060 [Candidatus Raymondbacteria bacterium RIFOXYA2_FULL_49_16]OGJ87195.1 MAG: hypothetical protein A2350_04310 [Candidatus Raymondbacteria bacterium RifOxyB12_full_50_8]OGJ91680.1 MAG: hypothetical protein A2268_13785 [Candidatus Raymondbacteria bacterium RifOxyA12_full_50_37]OGJ95209.1 MAG: hypothetical protein A2453_12070 [Candidatus Raymondbacteria bacterium RIFOXYC2_FULL_50_21]OGJ99066.1 MAG: hypothetical protein A2487_03475 [Candidatus Raymondbacteria b
MVRKLVFFLCLLIFLSTFVHSRKIEFNGSDIRQAMKSLESNDTLLIFKGVYAISGAGWMENKENIALISRDGPGKAIIRAMGKDHVKEPISFFKCKNITVDGLEVRNAGSNLLKTSGCENVVIRNCYLHTAFGMSDCIKVCSDGKGGYSKNVLITGCIIHSPGLNSGVGAMEFEENLDFMHTAHAVVRDCWMFHIDTLGNQLAYAKGGSRDILFENCLFGPQSAIAWDPAVGGGVANVKEGYNVENETVINCVFIDCPHGAIGSFGTKNYMIRNNVFFNCGHRTRESPPQMGIIHVKNGGGAARNSVDFRISGNIFYNDKGKDVYALCAQGVLINGMQHDSNSYFNKNANVLASSEYDPKQEKHATWADPFNGRPPLFKMPALDSTWNWNRLDSLRRAVMATFRK